MAKQSKKGKGLLKDQIAKLEAEIGADGVAAARKLANETPEVVKLAFRYIPRGFRKPDGLSKNQRRQYFQMVEEIGQEAANKWRNNRLSERGLDPAVIGPEPAMTDQEKAKINKGQTQASAPAASVAAPAPQANKGKVTVKA